jgi:hypothetical protein
LPLAMVLGCRRSIRLHAGGTRKGGRKRAQGRPGGDARCCRFEPSRAGVGFYESACSCCCPSSTNSSMKCPRAGCVLCEVRVGCFSGELPEADRRNMSVRAGFV